MASHQASKKVTKTAEKKEQPQTHKVTKTAEKKEQPQTQKGDFSHTAADIGHYRAQAQQNSMDAIRGAEERYEKAKKDSASKAEETAEHGHRRGVDVPAGKVRDASAEETGGGGEDVGVVDTALHLGRSAASYAGATAAQAAGTTAEMGKKAAGTTAEVGKKAAGTTAEIGKKAAGTTAEVGKSTLGYAGEKAVQAKDVALETGMKAAHYTLQKATGATETLADLQRKGVEVTGKKAEEVRQGAARKEQMAKEHEARMQQETDQAAQGEYHGTDQPVQAAHGAGSLMGAVGETVGEIAQTAKGMVTGHCPVQKEHPEN